MVGSFGRRLSRRAPVTASGTTLPFFRYGEIEVMFSKTRSTSPRISSRSVSGPPLYGICVMDTPAIALNISALRWPVVPLPPEPTESLPGALLASVISPETDFTPRPLRTASMFCTKPVKATRASCLSAS